MNTRNSSVQFSQSHQEIARFAKALSHPARVAIMELLVSRCQCTCGFLTDELPIAQSTISQHLKALKDAGLIQGEIEGPSIKYCIHKDNYEKMRARFAGLETPVQNLIQKCC